MPTILLPVPHKQQQQDADCLAACAAMVLTYAGRPTDYKRLLKLLKVKHFGASGRNLTNLTALGVQVVYREGSLAELKNRLLNKTPCITLVRTADLPYWSYNTNHVVVVVGFEAGTIYVNDPAFAAHPQSVSEPEFELAWLAFDYRYGVITS